MINLRTPAEISAIRESCQIVVAAITRAGEIIEPGMTSEDIDAEVEKVIVERGGRPAFKGYQGFPASACISINDVVVHGIPNSQKIKSGDIVTVDVGVELNGYYGDAAKSFAVGKIDKRVRELLKVTRDSLYLGIDNAQAGNRISDISHSVQTHVEKAGFSVVRQLVGHGIGTALHEEPQVPNYGKPGKGPRLRPGMVLAIEPMVNLGTYDVITDEDGWTIRTADSSISAHFEHTVAITENGAQILTEGL
jgi:methionyl aminopeptidase